MSLTPLKSGTTQNPWIKAATHCSLNSFPATQIFVQLKKFGVKQVWLNRWSTYTWTFSIASTFSSHVARWAITIPYLLLGLYSWVESINLWTAKWKKKLLCCTNLYKECWLMWKMPATDHTVWMMTTEQHKNENSSMSRIWQFIDCFSTILEDEVKCWKYNMTFEYPLQDWWRMQSSKC